MCVDGWELIAVKTPRYLCLQHMRRWPVWTAWNSTESLRSAHIRPMDPRCFWDGQMCMQFAVHDSWLHV